MSDIYSAPDSNLVDDEINNSGQGKVVNLPDGVKGWSWGAFLLNWIWAIGNKTWIGVLAIIPYVGFIVTIYLGIKGRELAWQNKRWDSVEHFQQVQKKWSFWGVVVFLAVIVLGIGTAVVVPLYANA